MDGKTLFYSINTHATCFLISSLDSFTCSSLIKGENPHFVVLDDDDVMDGALLYSTFLTYPCNTRQFSYLF